MSVGHATLRADTFLFGRLAVDATITAQVPAERIYVDSIEDNAPFPLIFIALNSPIDVRGVNVRIMENAMYVVRAVKPAESYDDLAVLANKIDELLDGASGPAGSGQVIGCTREGPFRLSEKVDGVEVRHLGGFYRVFVQ